MSTKYCFDNRTLEEKLLTNSRNRYSKFGRNLYVKRKKKSDKQNKKQFDLVRAYLPRMIRNRWSSGSKEKISFLSFCCHKSENPPIGPKLAFNFSVYAHLFSHVISRCWNPDLGETIFVVIVVEIYITIHLSLVAVRRPRLRLVSIARTHEQRPWLGMWLFCICRVRRNIFLLLLRTFSRTESSQFVVEATRHGCIWWLLLHLLCTLFRVFRPFRSGMTSSSTTQRNYITLLMCVWQLNCDTTALSPVTWCFCLSLYESLDGRAPSPYFLSVEEESMAYFDWHLNDQST